MTPREKLRLSGVFRIGYGINPKAIWQTPELSRGAKTLWMYYASYTGTGDTCFPGVDTTADHLGIKDRTVRRLNAELEAKGYISVYRQAGMVNEYTLNMAKEPPLPGDLPTEAEMEALEADARGGGMSPDELPTRGDPGHQGPGGADTRGPTPRTPGAPDKEHTITINNSIPEKPLKLTDDTNGNGETAVVRATATERVKDAFGRFFEDTAPIVKTLRQQPAFTLPPEPRELGRGSYGGRVYVFRDDRTVDTGSGIMPASELMEAMASLKGHELYQALSTYYGGA